MSAGAGAPPGALMAAEIAEQPAALARLLSDGTGAVRDVAAAIAARAPRVVLLAARGTSDHAALYAKYLVEIGLGLPAGLASPSALTVYGARPDLSQTLWITVSQSGGSTDLVESTRAARAAGALTVGDAGAAPWATAALALPETDERLAPILQIIPLQRLALEMAVARGHDPDAPRGLAKVTETR